MDVKRWEDKKTGEINSPVLHIMGNVHDPRLNHLPFKQERAAQFLDNPVILKGKKKDAILIKVKSWRARYA